LRENNNREETYNIHSPSPLRLDAVKWGARNLQQLAFKAEVPPNGPVPTISGGLGGVGNGKSDGIACSGKIQVGLYKKSGGVTENGPITLKSLPIPESLIARRIVAALQHPSQITDHRSPNLQKRNP